MRSLARRRNRGHATWRQIITDVVFCDEPRSNVMSSRTTEGSGKTDAVVLFDARRLHVRAHVLFFEKALIHQRDHYPHNPDPLSH